MNSFVRGLIAEGLGFLTRIVERVSLDLAKIEAARAYVKTVANVRLVVMGIVGLIALIDLLVFSFIVMTFAVIWMLDIAVFQKAILLLAVNSVYLLACVVILLIAFSERRWMRMSKADKMVAQATAGVHHAEAPSA